MSDAHFKREELLAAEIVYHFEKWQVRLQDVDAAGIVFFARILEVCHDAYIRFWQKQSDLFRENLRSFRLLSPLIHAQADFLRPLRFLDEVEVQIVRIIVTERKYVLGYRLLKKEQQLVVAIAQTVHVFVDPDRFERILVPNEVKTQLDQLISHACSNSSKERDK